MMSSMYVNLPNCASQLFLPVMTIQHSVRSALLAAGLLIGWQVAGADTLGSPAIHVRPADKPGAATKAGLVTGALRTSKTTLDLRIDYSFEAPSAGSTSEVRLKVAGNEAGRQLTIAVTPGAGLLMVRGLPGDTALQSAPSGEHTLSIAPTGDGLHYLNVFLRAGNQSEALAIAVPVGKNPVAAKAVEPRTLPDGRRVIAIPSRP
jgi:hypothetical protein